MRDKYKLSGTVRTAPPTAQTSCFAREHVTSISMDAARLWQRLSAGLSLYKTSEGYNTRCYGTIEPLQGPKLT